MSDAELSPEARLVLNRERMRAALRPRAPRASKAEETGSANRDADWLAQLQLLPGLDAVVCAVRDWWAAHPLRAAARLASESAQAVVVPLVRRHPRTAVVAAFVIGGVLIRLKPWRWLAGQGSAAASIALAGLLPQLLKQVAALMPLQSWWMSLTSPPGQSDRAESAD